MQTLFVPDKIQIDFLDTNHNPLHQVRILIGINTFANHKNNVSLFPFLTDSLGSLTITPADINDRFRNFVLYGLMDYAPLETAKPEIEIYLWGNNSLDRYINYWTKLRHIEQRIQEELPLYETCYNRTAKFSDDVILVKDKWDKANSEPHYKIKLDTK